MAENLFQKLDKVSKYQERVEPCKYYMYLLWGILLLAMNLNMTIHLYKNLLTMVDKKTVSPWLNTPLIYIRESYWNCLAPILLSIIGFYLLYCAFVGHNKFGQRFYSVNFYPLVERNTFVTGFFGNCMMFILYASAVTQLLCQEFDGYLVGTTAAKIWNV